MALCVLAGCAVSKPMQVGPTLVSTGQLIHPAGISREVDTRPVSMARSPDGRFLFVKDNRGLTVLDSAELAVRQQLAVTSKDAASMTGIAQSADGRRLFFTDATTGLHVLSVTAEGVVAKERRIELPGPKGKDRNSFPCGIAISHDGETAWVCLSRNNALGRVELASGKLTAQVPVGVAPYEVVLSPDGGLAYVSDWGGRRPKEDEHTADSSGTPTLIDERGVAASGGVSIVDLAAGREIEYVETGLSASALSLSEDGAVLFVANCNQDTVSVIDTASRRVIRQIVVKPDLSLPFGSMPSALAWSGRQRALYVACSGNNAVARVRFANGPASAPTVDAWIPTGWYPGALLATDEYLFVANVKGIGSRNAREDGAFNTRRYRGTIQRVPIRDDWTQTNMSRQAICDAGVPQVLRTIERGERSTRKKPVPVPAKAGEPSVFEHVIYIIKENRSYDQIFGDMGGEKPAKGRGEPKLCIYGREVTANQHALADQFVLLDNYYCNGVLSADGHSWATEGSCTPYLERSFGGFKRSYTYGDDPLTYSSSGFIWDHVLAAGLSFRNFGEFNGAAIKPPDGEGKRWVDVFRDWKTGRRAYQFPAHIELENLRRYSDLSAPGWNMDIPDQVRADRFIAGLREFETRGDMPNLIIIHLPNDHTAGVAEGKPTPRACVADNDLAVGRVIEAVSHSKFWPKTCFFINEDDPQDGWDHIDGHRSTCLVVSPYSRRGAVVSKFYNQAGVVNTIERILGLTAVNQLYAVAPLMSGCFSSKPDFTPYTAISPAVAIDELTPPKQTPSSAPGEGKAPPSEKKQARNGRSGLDSVIAAESVPDLYEITARQDFSKPDMVNERDFNLVLWHAARGINSPYPAAFSGAHGRGLRKLGLKLDGKDDDDD
ncbi:MAG TPA: bifunctional YncE family protein/alkaline phosphatase family protein [Phycisphaerae bacterium]|nr:bifunctional YncE family protein/alkaline phosphatase family protein [Phycisphaerae bacterium]